MHTDHLNTPRKVAHPTTGTLAWRWDADPFGAAAPNQNPAGLGTFPYNLRLPGQYYMAETGLSQNVNRNYDPLTGRYVEGDPIGINGGINSYAYVWNSPNELVDPLGLAAWPVNGSWTQARHLAYSEFMRGFVQTYNDPIDCADLALLGLIRFAAANGLPVNLRYWADSSWQSYDSSSDAFSSQAQFERTVLLNMGALNVIDNTVAITPDQLRAGDFMMTKYSTTLGHTRVVTQSQCPNHCTNPFVTWYQGNLPPVVPQRRSGLFGDVDGHLLPTNQVPRRWNFGALGR